ncbi:MAG: serpin family protein [Isosphaeraceae bacterium]
MHPSAPAPPGPEVKPVVAANTRFACDLYGLLRTGSGNLFLSPYSISTALAMTFAGARGSTARQMAQTLHFDPAPESVHAAFRGLIAHINGADGAKPGSRPYQLDTANALWGDQSEPFLPDFLELTRKNYGAGLRQVDFRNHPDVAARTINAWVEEQTRDKIRDLIGPSDVDRTTSLVLTNAIYFKGDWAHPFREAATKKDGVFHAPGGRQVTTPLMAMQRSFPYAEGDGFQVLEMPYAGDALSMVVVLPRKNDGLPDLEARLTEANLQGWLGKLRPREAQVEFPRFKLTESFRLASILRDLGMTDAFDGSKADFSGMNGQRDLLISEVIHKAFVDVNEKGTEAAAATGVVMTRAMAIAPAPPAVFRADHPFLFLIRDRVTDSILFLGRVLDPSRAEG